MTDDLKERLTRKADEIWLMAAEEAGKTGKPVYPRDVLRAWIVPNLLAEIDAAGYAVVPRYDTAALQARAGAREEASE